MIGHLLSARLFQLLAELAFLGGEGMVPAPARSLSSSTGHTGIDSPPGVT
jgi:hypothetical protein